MEKCKYCQAELAENGAFCPNCGKNNAESALPEEAAAAAVEPVAEEILPEETAAPEQEAVPEAPAEEKKKATPGKIALAVAAVVVLAALLIALVTSGAKSAPGADAAGDGEPAATAAVEEVPATVPADGNPEDVTCKGTYTVTDEEAVLTKDAVVATMGDSQLTNAQLRIYYRSALATFMNSEYGYYMMMYGALDGTKPLDTQLSTEGEGITWQQYFVQRALDSWRLSQAMANEAEQAGMEIPEEDMAYLESLRGDLEQTASDYAVTLEEMLYSDFGAGVGYEEFEAYQKLYLQGNPYYEAETAKLVPTQEDLEAYFTANEEAYASGGITRDSRYVDVRHILVQVKGGFSDAEGNMTHTEEEWAECEAAAQEILDQWLAGDKTEESFGELAKEFSEDPGSRVNGGLYEDVYMGQMVEPFETWCFDESRQYGDTGLVTTSYGCHVMYYVGSSPMWISYAEGDWINEQTDALLTRIMETYPMEVAYENITLSQLQIA